MKSSDLLMRVLLGLGILSINGIAVAAKKAPAKFVYTTETLASLNEAAASIELPAPNESALVKAEQNQRRPTATEADAGLETIKKDLWACTNSEQLSVFLNGLSRHYDELTPAAKVFAIHVLPMRALRGFLWKSKVLFEKNSKFIQSSAVTSLRKVAGHFSVHMPLSHMKALLDYVSAPYSSIDDSGIKGFDSEPELQSFLVRELSREIKLSARRLQDLKIQSSLPWDNQIIQGENSFKDGIRQISRYGKAERLASLATFYHTLHNLSIFSAYHVDGSLKTIKEVGNLYGLDGFKNLVSKFSQVDGVTQIDKTLTIQKNKVFGTLIDKPIDFGKHAMALAYTFEATANTYFQALWNGTNGVKSNEDDLLQAGFFNIRRAQKERVVQLFNDLYTVQYAEDKRTIVPQNRAVDVKNFITKAIVKINIEKMYLDPPTDLKDFLPDSGRPRKAATAVVTNSGKTQTLEYRDYLQGAANSWKTDKYAKYFPNATSDEGVKDVFKAIGLAGGLWVTEGSQ